MWWLIRSSPAPPRRRPTRDNLVPIRVDLEVDGQRYRDAFTWNPRGGLPAPLSASCLASSPHLPFALSLGRRIDSLAAPGAQTPTRRSSASPSGRPRTSSCRPISSPRCSSPSRCLSHFLLACLVLQCYTFVAYYLVNCIILNRGNLRSSAPTRGRRCRSRRRLCLSRFG